MALTDTVKRQALTRLPDTQLVCRVRGHRWPDLVPGRPVPVGITSVYIDGVFERTEDCERCGKVRSKVVLPPGAYPSLSNGVHPPGATWRYHDPDDWEAFTLDDDLSRGDMGAEFDYRMREALYQVPGDSR
jgi:hypothetical protein